MQQQVSAVWQMASKTHLENKQVMLCQTCFFAEGNIRKYTVYTLIHADEKKQERNLLCPI